MKTQKLITLGLIGVMIINLAQLLLASDGVSAATDAINCIKVGVGLKPKGTQCSDFTLTIKFTPKGGTNGIATTVARGDHTHSTVECNGPSGTDQTAAINSAITAIGDNGKVTLSGKTCLVSGELDVAVNDLELDCQGTTIKNASNFSGRATLYITGARNYVHSCEINGNSIGASGIGIVGQYNRIMNNSVHDMGTHGIDVDGQPPDNTACRDNYIAFNEVYSNGAVGMGTNHCQQVRFIGNSVHNNKAEGITCDNQSHFCVITNNVISDNGATGGIGTDNSNYIIVSGNVSQNNTNAGISVNNQGGFSDHGVITGNTLLTNAGGIYLHTCVPVPARPECHGTYGTVAFLVTGNNIEGDSYTIKIDTDGPGISNGNIVTGNSVSGVQPTADYQRNHIINNW